MKRYYLSKIFKDMSNPMFPEGVWRHKLQTYANVDYQGGEIKVDPVTGEPTEKALLVLVAGINHQQFQADTGIVPMPDVGLDTKISAVHTPTKLATKARVKALGFADGEVEDLWGNADGIKDVLNHYGKLNNADFDADNFDVDES